VKSILKVWNKKLINEKMIVMI